MNRKRRFHISEVAEEVQDSSSRRPWHEPQYIKPIDDASTYACVSKFDFQITLENSFVLVFVLAPQPWNSDAGWRASSRTIILFVS